MVQAVVEAHATHNHFVSYWSEAKDRDSEPEYPFVSWDEWNSRWQESASGILEHVHLVRLMIVTTVATDRTAAQRNTAVNQAEEAANDFIVRLRADYPDVVFDDFQFTTQFDERTALETGGLLSFTVRAQAECEVDDNFQVVTVNGEDYDGYAVEVVDQDGNPVGSLNGDGKWEVNVSSSDPMILPYADESAALAATGVTPTTSQVVHVVANKRFYPGDGSSTVAQLVTAQQFLLPVTMPGSGALIAEVDGSDVKIQLNES